MSISDNNKEDNTVEKKKISLEEAFKQKLAKKRQDQLENKYNTHPVKNKKNFKSQQTKKANNQRRRTGV